MGLFDQFIVGPEGEPGAPVSAPPAAPPAAAPAAPGAFGQFIRGPDEQEAAATPPPARAFNQPFGELKSYTPSPSERIGQWASDAFRGAGADPYTAGKFGRGARDILMLTPAGVAISGADSQFYANKGDFGNAAWSALGTLPAGRLGGSAVRDLTTPRNLPLNFAENPAAEFRPAPSSEQLTTSGSTGFNTFRGSGQEYPVQDVAKFVDDAKQSLNARGSYATDTGKSAHNAFDVLAEKTKTQPVITAPDMDELRAALGNASKTGDSGAMHGRSLLYDYLKSTGDTTMEKAVGDYGAGKRTGIVEQILTNADMAKNPDVALANKLRSEVQKVNVRPRGFAENEVEALDAARTAGSTREKLGNAALKYGVAPTTLGAGGAATAAILGLVDPMTAVKTTLLPMAAGTVGGALKVSGAAARRGAAQEAADLIAQRSPMYETAKASGYAGVEKPASGPAPVYYGPGATPGGGTPPVSPLRLQNPGTPAQNFVMRNAITQALINRQRGQ